MDEERYPSMSDQDNQHFEVDQEKRIEESNRELEEKRAKVDQDVKDQVDKSIQESLDNLTNLISQIKDMENYVEKDDLRSVSLVDQIVLEYKAIALKSDRDSAAFKEAKDKVDGLLKDKVELIKLKAVTEKTQDQIKQEELEKANALKKIDDIKEVAKKLKEEIISVSPNLDTISNYVNLIEENRIVFESYRGYISEELYKEVIVLMDDILKDKQKYLDGTILSEENTTSIKL